MKDELLKDLVELCKYEENALVLIESEEVGQEPAYVVRDRIMGQDLYEVKIPERSGTSPYKYLTVPLSDIKGMLHTDALAYYLIAGYDFDVWGTFFSMEGRATTYEPPKFNLKDEVLIKNENNVYSGEVGIVAEVGNYPTANHYFLTGNSVIEEFTPIPEEDLVNFIFSHSTINEEGSTANDKKLPENIDRVEAKPYPTSFKEGDLVYHTRFGEGTILHTPSKYGYVAVDFKCLTIQTMGSVAISELSHVDEVIAADRRYELNELRARVAEVDKMVNSYFLKMKQVIVDIEPELKDILSNRRG